MCPFEKGKEALKSKTKCLDCDGKGKVEVIDYRTSPPKEEAQKPKPSKQKKPKPSKQKREFDWELVWNVVIPLAIASFFLIVCPIIGVRQCNADEVEQAARNKLDQEDLAKHAFVIGWSDLKGKRHCSMVDARGVRDGYVPQLPPMTSLNYQYSVINDRNDQKDVLRAEQLLGIDCNFETGEVR